MVGFVYFVAREVCDDVAWANIAFLELTGWGCYAVIYVGYEGGYCKGHVTVFDWFCLVCDQKSVTRRRKCF